MTAYNTLSDINMKIKPYGKQKRIFIDNKSVNQCEIEKQCGLYPGILNKYIRTDKDPVIRIKCWMIKRSHGLANKTRLYIRGDFFTWNAEVMEASGCNLTTARWRIKRWLKDGDCDKLYSPVDTRPKHTYNPGNTTKAKPKKKRRDIRTLRPVGTWERENL